MAEAIFTASRKIAEGAIFTSTVAVKNRRAIFTATVAVTIACSLYLRHTNLKEAHSHQYIPYHKLI